MQDQQPSFFPFQLTPSRRATQHIVDLLWRVVISTHALTEGDCTASEICFRLFYFNSRHHGGRPQRVTASFVSPIFQLTPSRRATPEHLLQIDKSDYFNSRPHGGRHYQFRQKPCSLHFNSRPHGGRPGTPIDYPVALGISTHALTEGDNGKAELPILSGYFNSRPHGGRRILFAAVLPTRLFQLTPSWRATWTSW